MGLYTLHWLGAFASLLPLITSTNATPIPYSEADIENMRVEGRSERDISQTLSPSPGDLPTPAYEYGFSVAGAHHRLLGLPLPVFIPLSPHEHRDRSGDVVPGSMVAPQLAWKSTSGSGGANSIAGKAEVGGPPAVPVIGLVRGHTAAGNPRHAKRSAGTEPSSVTQQQFTPNHETSAAEETVARQRVHKFVARVLMNAGQNAQGVVEFIWTQKRGTKEVDGYEGMRERVRVPRVGRAWGLGDR